MYGWISEWMDRWIDGGVHGPADGKHGNDDERVKSSYPPARRASLHPARRDAATLTDNQTGGGRGSVPAAAAASGVRSSVGAFGSSSTPRLLSGAKRHPPGVFVCGGRCSLSTHMQAPPHGRAKCSISQLKESDSAF